VNVKKLKNFVHIRHVAPANPPSKAMLLEQQHQQHHVCGCESNNACMGWDRRNLQTYPIAPTSVISLTDGTARGALVCLSPVGWRQHPRLIHVGRAACRGVRASSPDRCCVPAIAKHAHRHFGVIRRPSPSTLESSVGLDVIHAQLIGWHGGPFHVRPAKSSTSSGGKSPV